MNLLIEVEVGLPTCTLRKCWIVGVDGLPTGREVRLSLELETQPSRTEDVVDEGALSLARRSFPCVERGRWGWSIECVPVAGLSLATLVAKVFGEGVGCGGAEGLPIKEGRQQVAVAFRVVDEVRL